MRFTSFLVVLIGLAGSLSAFQLKGGPGEKKTGYPLTQLVALLGKDHFSDEMQQFREKLKGTPVAKYSTYLGKCFYHSWNAEGVSLRFNGENQLECIYLYADGMDGFKEYKGELPAGLSFADNADAVEKKLGRPAEVLGGCGVHCWREYPAKGLAVTFQTKDCEDRKARVAWLVLSVPEPEKKE